MIMFSRYKASRCLGNCLHTGDKPYKTNDKKATWIFINVFSPYLKISLNFDIT